HVRSGCVFHWHHRLRPDRSSYPGGVALLQYRRGGELEVGPEYSTLASPPVLPADLRPAADCRRGQLLGHQHRQNSLLVADPRRRTRGPATDIYLRAVE